MVFTKSTTTSKARTIATRSSPRIARKTNGANTESNQTSIKVIVRVRPPNQKESQDNYRTIIKICNSQLLVFDPKEEDDPFFYRGVAQKGRDILKKQNKNLEFVFNKVFDSESTNADVFEGSTRDMIASLLEGYNCSVFAYGATGAGKTHTMLGKENDPGITYRTVAELFQQIDSLQEQRDFNLGVTYLEIYNENVQDLLEKKGPLFLREDGQRGVVVTGLKVITIHNASELLELLSRGNKNRTQFPTDANGESSRSHAVFQVYINMKNKLDGQVKKVKLSMIDLAGSERASVTGCKGDRFKEGANINKSLLALGNCINNLADGVKHIPYRDSKLTRLLKDSLGGNCQTVMIANISPSSFSYEDTYNTLRYANRAKKIKTSVKKNIVASNFSASDYASMLEEAKREVKILKAKLEAYENSGAPKVTSTSNGVAEKAEKAAEKEAAMKKQAALFLDKMQTLWDRKKTLNEKIMSLESKEKILCCRTNIKNAAEDRLSCLTAMLKPTIEEEQNASGKKRVKKTIDHFEKQRDRIRKESEAAWLELQSVEQELQTIEKSIAEKNLSETMSKEGHNLKLSLRKVELEKARATQQHEHAKKICSLLQCDSYSNSNIIKTISELTQNYYSVINTQGCLTEDMKLEFQKVVKKLEGVRGIKWSDDAMSKEEEDFYNMTVLNVEKLDNPTIGSDLNQNDADQSEHENMETEASNSMNSTFSVEGTRTVKKRALTEQNVDKDASPAKQARKIVTTTSTKKNGLLGKENNKDPLKLAMSAKSLELLNRIKMERMKSSQNKVPEKTITKVNANQKNTKALPSTRVPWV